jgi:hypothetical protein
METAAHSPFGTAMSLLETGGRDGITSINNFNGHASGIRFDTASPYTTTNHTHIGITRQHLWGKHIERELWCPTVN